MSKRNLVSLSLAFIFSFVFISCNKRIDSSAGPVIPGGGTGIDAERVNATVSGAVFNETNQPVPGATVTCGGKTTQTNSMGIFNFPQVNISKNNGFFVVEKTGYFKGIKTFITNSNSENYVRIQLMQKGAAKSFVAATGAVITNTDGSSITFPANAFTTTSGSLYTGTVNIISRWINPTAANLSFIMPGDLRGLDTAGTENALISFGMLGAELEDDKGNALKLASGVEATISLPIPAAINAGAPATIPLWHFNETTARWVQEGTAIKSGNNYVGRVKKFSFWNCDLGLPVVRLSFTATSSVGNLALAQMKIRITAGTGIQSSTREEYTNYLGYLLAGVPANQPLKLEILNNCGSIVYTQNIAPLSSDKYLGILSINPGPYVSVSATIVNCANSAVTDGYLAFSSDILGTYLIRAGANGVVNFAIPVCAQPNNAIYSFQTTDLSTGQLSNLNTGVCSGYTLALGTSNACGNTAASGVYIGGSAYISNVIVPVIWKDGVAKILSNGTVSGQINKVVVQGNDVYAAGVIYSNNAVNYDAALWKNDTLQALTGTAQAWVKGLAVDNNNNVYVSGQETPGAKPVLWKNGARVVYNNPYPTGSYNDITTNGSDVYIAGELYQSTTVTYLQGFWKNGVFNQFTTPLAHAASAIQINGTDVYVGGSIRQGSNGERTAAVWKNGSLLYNSAPLTDVFIRGIAVTGTGVTVCGTYINAAFNRFGTIWNNGIPTILTQGNLGDMNGMFIKNNDIYLCGRDWPSQQGSSVVKYWKNNIPVLLTDQLNDATANSIFVK